MLNHSNENTGRLPGMGVHVVAFTTGNRQRLMKAKVHRTSGQLEEEETTHYHVIQAASLIKDISLIKDFSTSLTDETVHKVTLLCETFSYKWTQHPDKGDYPHVGKQHGEYS